MTLKIEKEPSAEGAVVRLSGRLRSEHLDQLRAEIEGDKSRFVLDLNAVTLVDVEIVRFLNECERRGIEVLHCPAYVREWMSREKD